MVAQQNSDQNAVSAEIRNTLVSLYAPEGAIELRAFVHERGRVVTYAGWFNDIEALTQEALKLEEAGGDVYITVNPVKEALLGRLYNECMKNDPKVHPLTSDADILYRRHILVDCDPVRPTKVSATDGEKAAAYERALTIKRDLEGRGFPECALADSGNGYHVLVPVRLPNDREATELVRRFLEALDFKYSDEVVHVDTSTHNAARITKCYGVTARKGADSPEIGRVHRPSRLLSAPDDYVLANIDLIEGVAGALPKVEPQRKNLRGKGQPKDFDIAAWIEEHDVPVKREGPWKLGGHKWVLEECPWNGHADNACYIVQLPDGPIAAGCHHESCQEYGWRDLREHYEPDAYSYSKRYEEPPNTPNTHNNTNRPNSPNSAVLTGKQLLELELPEVEWVIEDVLPEGLALLAGKPKKGKSWMALQMCLGVASGERVFGRCGVKQGESLYLALEDNHRRLKKRLKKMLHGEDMPDGIHLTTEWPRLHEGGAEKLDAWLSEHPDASLVVIDTLARVRKPVRGQAVYHEDYTALESLLPLASRHRVAIVVIHHLRKTPGIDAEDEISASTGLTGGVDGWMILRHSPGGKGPVLAVDGRDIENPTEYALSWNALRATWTIEGDAEEVYISKERAKIRRILEKSNERLSPKDLAELIPGSNRNSIRYLMWCMFNDGQLIKDEDGCYGLPVGAVGTTPQQHNSAHTAAKVPPVGPVGDVSEEAPLSQDVAPGESAKLSDLADRRRLQEEVYDAFLSFGEETVTNGGVLRSRWRERALQQGMTAKDFQTGIRALVKAGRVEAREYSKENDRYFYLSRELGEG
jgi:hypothetical protein